jgi:ferredoxin
MKTKDRPDRKPRSQRARRYTQLMAAVLYNCNFRGFAEGKISKGSLKGVCTPGLNCYSCPGAVAACPLGSLQSALVNARYRFPYYILGTLLLMGLFLGRFICGFLCPVGLLQELLHKLPSPKIRKSRATRVLSHLKYVLLAVFVILIPLWKLAPGFCKFICPAGTFEAGLPLTFKNKFLRTMTGTLFSWKVLLLTLIAVLCVVCFRAFCRFLCPLGAIYSFFNPVSLFGVRVDQSLCTHCDACVKSCPMDVTKVRDRECIQCGMCIGSCPTGAIHFGVKDAKGKGTGEVIISTGTPATTRPVDASIPVAGKASTASQFRRRALIITAIILFIAGASLLGIGLCTGGFQDVMNKAIRICYECIGIG